jgi:putative flippase GtrA
VDSRISQLLRFCFVGVITTAIQYAILITGVERLGVPAWVSSGVGFAISAGDNYGLNYRFTFRSKRSHRLASRRFAMVTATGLIFNIAFMVVLHDVLHLQYVFAQIIVTAIVLLWNFAGHARWSF